MTTPPDVVAAVPHFRFAGEFERVVPYGSGHINDTWCIFLRQASEVRRFILQRINTAIFPDPAVLMRNIERVTLHIAAGLHGQPDAERRVLRLIPTLGGRPFHSDDYGHVWRAYHFIPGARTFDTAESPAQAYQAARAFGLFQQQLADLPAPPLAEIIPGFHHTPSRFAAFERALQADVVGRSAEARREIEFALAHRPLSSLLVDAGLPQRVTHNDTKFNNVLLDDATGEAVCVVDLDTVMPGLAAYDFGDMVRTTTSPAAEDERDLSHVAMRFPMFEALLRGYLSSAGPFLTLQEKRSLAVAGSVITFEIGLRFLADFLAGDTYFKVHRPGHNLDRCRTQFRLVESIEQQQHSMTALVDSLL